MAANKAIQCVSTATLSMDEPFHTTVRDCYMSFSEKESQRVREWEQARREMPVDGESDSWIG